MKRITSIILILCMLFAVMPVSAYAENADITYSLDIDTGVLTVSGTGRIESAVVTDKTLIPYIKTVVIEEGITYISYGFNNYTELECVHIPASVTGIAYQPFSGCTSLKEFIVDAENESYTAVDGVLFNKQMTSLHKYPAGKAGVSYTVPKSVETIIPQAFCDSVYLVNITFMEKVKTADVQAFFEASALCNINVVSGNSAFSSLDGVLFSKDLTELKCYPRGRTEAEYTVPDGVTSVGERAFWKCASLTGVTFPDSLTSVGYYSFNNCTSLSDITLPDSVVSVGSDAFYNTAYYNNADNRENNALYIGKVLIDVETDTEGEFEVKSGTLCIAHSAFSGCEKLTSVTIPGSVKRIEGVTFFNCKALTGIEIPEGVTYLNIDAFSRCAALESINIPSTVTEIDMSSYSLEYCTALKEVNVDENNAVYKSVNGVLYSKDLTKLYLYPHGKGDIKYTVPEGATEIYYSAFRHCASLESITLPDSLAKVGICAFEGCTALEKIYYIGSEDQFAGVTVHSYNNGSVFYR